MKLRLITDNPEEEQYLDVEWMSFVKCHFLARITLNSIILGFLMLIYFTMLFLGSI